MSAEHLEGVNGSVISLSNLVKHESQPVTPDIPDGSGSGSNELRVLLKGWTCLLI